MADLIDRQAALDAISAWRRDYPLDLQEPIDDCWNSVRELPAVQPDHVADVSKKAEGDCISRQAAIDALDCINGAEEVLRALPSAQPDHVADIGKKVERTDETAQNVQNEDLISRKWLVECIEEGWVKFDTAKDCNRMMHLVRDIAPSVQPEQNAQDEDLISRKAAIEALARMMPRSYTPDGSHPADEEIFRAQEVFADCIEALEILPSAQPATNCSEIPNGSDDTISRQAAIDALDEQIEQCNKALGSFNISPKDEYAIKVERASLEAYKEQLENMPSAQLEQNGKWIYNSPMTMKCDRCGFAIKDWDWHRFKYCPNCGARMKGGDE